MVHAPPHTHEQWKQVTTMRALYYYRTDEREVS